MPCRPLIEVAGSVEPVGISLERSRPILGRERKAQDFWQKPHTFAQLAEVCPQMNHHASFIFGSVTPP